MLQSVEGYYRNGKLELLETPPGNLEGRVLVTFLQPQFVDLRERGIDEQQAADLRRRLNGCAGDWDQPEMDVYDAL